MSDFLNIKNGVVSITSYRLPNAQATDVKDIVNAYTNETNETLTASLDLFIKEELEKIDLSICDDVESAKNYIFGEADFLELTLKDLGLEISEYTDLRDWQNDFIYDYFTE